jgi:biopolymer transport protein ExbB
MFSRLFLEMSLLKAEWILYLLLFLSVVSIGLILERAWFYRRATKGLNAFRDRLRRAVSKGEWAEAVRVAEERVDRVRTAPPDIDSGVALTLLQSRSPKTSATSGEVLQELAQDTILRTKILWEQNLSVLATIGSNAPFVGLFGTVIGIIKAFHDLSMQTGGTAPQVTAGISEALVSTAVGIFVAVPAVVAFNLFQRRIKAAVAEADALKSFLIGKLIQ